MSDESSNQNPFQGTPFEHIFRAFSSGKMGGLGDMGEMMSQLQQLMSPYSGPVNWGLAEKTAHDQLKDVQKPDQSLRDLVNESVRLADHWLDSVTEFPSGISVGAAWTRSEWVANSLPTWQVLVNPIATHINGGVIGALPEEIKAMTGQLGGMLTKLGGNMYGAQVGQGLGQLATEILTASEIGIPVGPAGQAGLITENIVAFAKDLDVSLNDVMLYLALREAAAQRLASNVSWLKDYITEQITTYGKGMEISTSGIEEKLRSFDPTNLAALQETLSEGLFQAKPSASQQAALSRIETTLALIEGWIDEVVTQATATRMPIATKIAEAIRRRRASGGPAETTFGALVGLELRPRRHRDAATLWASLRTRFDAEARDAVWQHPQLLPSAADLDDPLGFREDVVAEVKLSDDEFDAELAKLLGDQEPPKGD